MRRKSCWLLLIISLSALLFSIRINNNKILLEYLPKTAGYWVTGPIEIDDTDPTKNWVITKATYDWCTGSGTFSDPYLIENVTVITGGSRGIQIMNSNEYFKISNCTILYGDDAIRLYNTNNGQVVGNNVSNNGGNGITLGDSSNITVYRNYIHNNSWYGIFLVTYEGDTTNNKIYDNSIHYNDQKGIYLYAVDAGEDCSNNDIWNNTVNNNQISGITLRSDNGKCNSNDIWNNTFDNNLEGIGLYSQSGNTNYNNILNNIIRNSSENGMHCWSQFHTCNNNDIIGNIFHNSTHNAIELSLSDNNVITGNNLSNSTLYGLLINTDTSNNKIFNNSFVENVVNALDSGSGNQWDNGSLGNFWDDYTGIDANDDGIGDMVYDVPPIGGSVDNFPIWDDGDDIGPQIVINSPKNNQVFENSAPLFNITLTDDSPINNTWYTIDNDATNYTFFTLVGPINQSAWDVKSTELITLKFYANDSLGHIGSNEVIIWKDTANPIIIIESPVSQGLYGDTSPFYNITIIEPNLETWGYTFDNISFYSVINFTGYFDPIAWQDLDNGTVLLTFFAHDLAGHDSYFHIIFRKDIIAPIINVYSPDDGDLFSFNAPLFNISIDDPNLLEWGYTLDDGVTNYTLSTLEGTINKTEWDVYANGTITIKFYAKDEVENIAFYTIKVEKDILAPELIVTTPSLNDKYGKIAPAFEIIVNDGNLDTVWYSLNGGLTNITITDMQGFLNQEQWELLLEGQITIIFYANDTLGNFGFVEVDFIKEIFIESSPSIHGFNPYIIILIVIILSILPIKENYKKRKITENRVRGRILS